MEIGFSKSVEDDRDPETVTSPEDIEDPLLLPYGDLYVLGRLWIDVLKKALVGTNTSLLPVVEAAVQKPLEGPPKKPPPMKYTDLPLYSSPHYEYKDYVEKTKKCPKANTKLLHEYLLPHVNTIRKYTQDTYCEIKYSLGEMKSQACESVRNIKRDFKLKMRDPDNLMIRRTAIVLGASTGYILSRGRSLPQRIFFIGIGTLATGALCFPKETDEAFRTLTYHTAKSGLAIYNLFCGKEFMLRERLLCKQDLPPPPQLRTMNPSPKK